MVFLFNIRKFIVFLQAKAYNLAGIYIHIPFCKQRCTYCDFYTEVAPGYVDQVVDTIVREVKLRRNYLGKESISTIYFGGGTPSVLDVYQFRKIFDEIHALFCVDDDAEITMEANPDDLDESYFQSINSLPFNRLSIGIQSFDDRDLKKVNRRHSALQAKEAVKRARNAGFDNISIDLIYGLPGQTYESWEKQIDQALELNTEHISIYGLTYEEGTGLWKQRAKGLVVETGDEEMVRMHHLMLLKMKEKGYQNYEISNFSKPGFHSRHNSSYWKFIPYLGIGPSAHSFDGKSRQWNIASIRKYIELIDQQDEFFEKEVLSETDLYNDYVMVALRTSEGIDIEFMKTKFNPQYLEYCLRNAAIFMQSGKLIKTDKNLYLSEEGVFISNMIISELMKTD